VLADSAVERVLAVAAHPDDLDFGSAGSIAKWTSRGVAVSYCIATYGDAGGFDDTPREQMPVLREAEQRAAGQVLGVSDIVFLGYPDGAVSASQDLRRDISREIRRVRPQIVLMPSPERNWERLGASHPDHLATGEAAVCAVYPDARNPFAFPELLAAGLEAWTVPEIWVMAGPRPNFWNDITDTFDLKVKALRAHVTQTGHREDLTDMLLGWHRESAETGGLPPNRLAEAFQVVSLPA
jgi:LmbE family N-acetylglucosaminyl deacetylase